MTDVVLSVQDSKKSLRRILGTRSGLTEHGTRRNYVGLLEAEVKRYGRNDGLSRHTEKPQMLNSSFRRLQPVVCKDTGEEWGHAMSWKRSQFSLRGLEPLG